MVRNNSTNYELNYVTANRFYVEMQSNVSASFSECSGMGVTINKEVFFEGGVNQQQRVILGQPKFSDIILKRGITDDMAFWEWINQTKIQRRNVNILLFNQAGETMQCWTLIAAVPVGWKAPALQTSGNSVALEELTLTYEGIKIAKSDGGGAINLSKRHSSGYFIT
ncbi:MAG TPA: phage tail protein [Trichormus sp. M33_DOE_039]|nr:phage tail protein [Trichormus sp. M33_DOE_039]